MHVRWSDSSQGLSIIRAILPRNQPIDVESIDNSQRYKDYCTSIYYPTHCRYMHAVSLTLLVLARLVDHFQLVNVLHEFSLCVVIISQWVYLSSLSI